MRELLRANARAGVRRGPGWWSHPWARATRFQRDAFEKKGEEYSRELNYRFAGVINLCLRSIGVTNQAELKKARSDISMTFHLKTLQRAEPELFAPDLWRSVQVHAGTAIGDAVKRRFMLRQFVEDVQIGPGRDALRRLAFEAEPGAPAYNIKDLDLARMTYPLLHHALAARGPLLDAMTDDAIGIGAVTQFQPPFGQFDRWLFEI